MSTRAIFLLTLLTSVCSAGNLSFLNDTALAALDEDDRTLQRAAAYSVLDAEDPVSSKEWKNDKSGSSGKIHSLGNYRSDDGLHCRKIRILTQAKSLKNDVTLPVCKLSDGDWIFASGKKLAKV
ncbi:MAG: RT0821/Lpp0805 family surface protein [Povalibacter sp.]